MASTESSIPEADLAQALAAYLSSHTGRTLAVEATRHLSSGWESDLYVFSAPGLTATADTFVLRQYYGAQAEVTAVAEARAYQVLGSGGYPAPPLVLVEPSPAPLGKPFIVMPYVQGEPLGRQFAHDGDAAVLARLAELMVQLHALPWASLEPRDAAPRYSLRGQLAQLDAYRRRFPSQSCDRALLWLQQRLPAVSHQASALIHFDFHPHNVLVDDAGRAWVIDWTQCQVTDPRIDVAWTMTLMGSERGRAVAELFQRAYATAAAQAGLTFHEPDMPYFEALAAARRLLSVLIALEHGAEALGMRPGAEAVMTGYLGVIAKVYDRWLDLTQQPLPELADRLASVT